MYKRQLGQNIHYLVNYRRALSALAKRLKNPAHRRQFEAWAEETAATERYTRDCFIRANPKQLDVLPISPTTQLYMGWEAQAASFLPVHEACLLYTSPGSRRCQALLDAYNKGTVRQTVVAYHQTQ